jgi:metal transporter CNNM
MIERFTYDEIQNAVEMLKSIGAVNLCHPEKLFMPGLPSCQNEEASIAGSRILFERQQFESHEEADIFFLTNILGVMAVVAFVALITGLFLGLLTLEPMDLLIIERASLDEEERIYAAGIYPIIKQRHLLLVTLLILNALAYETLPLFLDNLVPSWAAVLLSTTLVLMFGEIIPSAIFTGPNQLKLGYHMVPLVRVFLFLMYPFAKPAAMLLDSIVHPGGEDESEEAYDRSELAALVKIQYEQRTPAKGRNKRRIQKMGAIQTAFYQKNKELEKESSWGAMKREMMEAVKERQERTYGGNKRQKSVDGAIQTTFEKEMILEMEKEKERPWREMKQEMLEDEEAQFEQLNPPMDKMEVDLVVGALQMKTKVAMDVFTPLSHVYAVPDDLVLDLRGLTEIYARGYSRVPVYHQVVNEVGNGDDGDDSEEDRSIVWGFLMTRQLMLIDWDHEREVSTLPLVRPDAISPRMNLVDILKLLKAGGSHMAFVCARPDLANKALLAEKPIPVEAGFIGLITLEDIMESILQDRIYDEVDIRHRDRAVATLTRWAAQKLQSFARKRKAQRERAERNAKQKLENPDGLGSTESSSSATDKTPLLGSFENNKKIYADYGNKTITFGTDIV